jgi:hypothetical protein
MGAGLGGVRRHGPAIPTGRVPTRDVGGSQAQTRRVTPALLLALVGLPLTWAARYVVDERPYRRVRRSSGLAMQTFRGECR